MLSIGSGAEVNGMKRVFAYPMVLLLTLSVNATQAQAVVKPGARCVKVNVKQVYKGKMYTCIKSEGKLVWSKGVVVTSMPSPTQTVAPTAAPTLTPIATSTATPKPTTSIATSSTTPKPTTSISPTTIPSPTNPFADAAAKAAADKAAADTAAKAAADKAAADAAAKAAADKAAADAAAKAVAEAAARICIPNSKCPLGSTGPGGGIVFYDAGAQQSWGRYLEFAPDGWSGSDRDPQSFWCNTINVDFSALINNDLLRATLGVEIGKGKANTDLMVAFCKSGAGVLARAYSGGGKSDWNLPSRYELNELCKYIRSQAVGKSDVGCNEKGTLRKGFAGFYYWSSTETNANNAWAQPLDYAFSLNYLKSNIFYIRPTRAF